MTSAHRRLTVDELRARITTLTDAKARDYAPGEDVLANFKRAAQSTGMSPFQVWAIYFWKHADAILGAIGKNPAAPSTETEPIAGRIMDAIAHLEILHCLMVEEEGSTQDPIYYENGDVRLPGKPMMPLRHAPEPIGLATAAIRHPHEDPYQR